MIIAGPVFAMVRRNVECRCPTGSRRATPRTMGQRPSFAVTLATVLLPVVLMMGKALADIFIDDDDDPLRRMLDILGTPLIALLIAVIVAIFTFGGGAGMDREASPSSIESSLPGHRRDPADRVPRAAASSSRWSTPASAPWSPSGSTDSDISVLLLAWLRRRPDPARHRLGDRRDHHRVRPARAAHRRPGQGEVSLVVLAIGAGSVFFSHVNDAGFWLVKEYFGMSVGQTIKTWSAMETLLSVTGLVFVMGLDLLI